MGDGIINLANIGWLIVLGVVYAGAVRLQEHGSLLTPEMMDKLGALGQKLQGFPPPFLAVGAWVVLRVLFALGWQLQLELLLVLASCTYVSRQLVRVKAKFALNLQRQLTSASDPAALLGKNLPEWVTFPSANRVQWLNTTINGLWPSIVGATEKSIRGILEPLLERSKPSFVYGFKLKSASIGNKPLILNGIQHHSYGSTETTLDISASWDAEMDIRLLVRVPGPDVEITVNDFEMRMTLRLTLGPHIPQWPCVANMAVSIVGTPEIDFDVTAGKVPLDSVPGLGSFIDNFIRNTLVSMLAYPKGYTIPIVQGYKLDMGLGAGALGTLKVKFLRVDNVLPKFSKYKKTPFYCKIVLLDTDKKRARGLSYTGFDSIMSDVFTFTLYDNTGTLRVWMYFDVVGQDVLVGVCDVPTAVLIGNELEEKELMIMKPDDPAKRRRVSIYVKPEFLPFEGKAAEGSTSAPPGRLPPRALSPKFIEHMREEHDVPDVPKSRGTTPRSSAMPQANSGTLFVTVVSAKNLRNLEIMSKSDPYVFLRVNGQTARSRHVNNDLNPTFNYSAELPVLDSTVDVLKLSVIDKNDVAKDQLMGYLEIPIARIVARKGETLSGEFELRPQGKITITLKFLRHG